LLDLKPEHKLLEIGCGRGEVCIYHSLNGGESKGVDYSSEAIELARRKAIALEASAVFFESSFDKLCEQESSYDRILASEFIEHISAQEGAVFFKMAYSLLKPGGKLLVYTMPNTLQRRYGYPLTRLLAAFRGQRLPRRQDDTLSEHYKLYHLNEQNYFSLKNFAMQAGFSKIVVGYDARHNRLSGRKNMWIRKFVERIPLRHILFSNLYVVAEK